MIEPEKHANLWLNMGLTPRQRAFVIEYVVDFTGTQAAIRAGYAEAGAGNTAYELLMNPEILAAIEERKLDLAARAGLTVEWVLRQWKEIAEADPAELISAVIHCCHYCYGFNHEYQWAEFEYAQAVEKAAAHRCGAKCSEPCEKSLPPAAPGGFGYDHMRPPVDDCPLCKGEGLLSVRVADTKRLKGSARRLYAGIKQTQHGIEVKMQDQAEARKNIAQWLGMLIERKELAGPGGGAIPIANLTADDLTDDQLAQFIIGESGGIIEGTLIDRESKQLTLG